MTTQRITIPQHLSGERLDKALILLLPHAGIRQRRRHIEQGEVRINGKPRAKGFAVSAGDTLTLHNGTQTHTSPHAADSPWLSKTHIVRATPQFAAIFKPHGLHTATIAGKSTPSLESLLPELVSDIDVVRPSTTPPHFRHDQSSHTSVPSREQNVRPDHNDAAEPESGPSLPLLVNRLDQLTSGMVMVAFGQKNAHRFKDIEDAGSVEKLYLTLLEGDVRAPCGVDASLDTANRSKTRVLDAPSPDPLRHTGLLPLFRLEHNGIPCTLVLASIHKGARHQIRAHCAHIGHPIVGDPLYGTLSQPETAATDGSHIDPTEPDTHSPIMFLHHYHIELPDFTATCPPMWPQWAEWSKHLRLCALRP